MKFLKNLIDNIRQPLTSILGLVIIIVTISMWVKGEITLQWEGIIGLSIGLILLLVPDKVAVLILKYANKVLNKITGNGSNG